MKMRTFRYLTTEGWRGMNRHRGMTFTAVITMAAGLLVLGAFLVVSYNILDVLNGLENRKEVAIYLNPGLTEDDRLPIENRLQMHPAVDRFEFVTKEQAWEEFSTTMEAEGLLEAVGGNPLPDAYKVFFKPNFRDALTINVMADEVRAWEEVDEVVTGGDWIQKLDDFAEIVMMITIAIGIAVALSIVAIVANTVRLTVLARDDLIEVMKLVGASENFIRLPFLSEGVLQSLMAGLLALGLLFGATTFLSREMDGIQFISPLWCAAFVGFAVLLGLMGSAFSLRQVLRRVGI